MKRPGLNPSLESEKKLESEEGVIVELGTELGLDDPKASELSGEFVGRWNELVSTTNWEKGRIIHQWREALRGSQAAAGCYSDEAWSLRVGGVTPQHVGRLRRVYQRFSDSYPSYPGLYWSHFLAALDWQDAEMWLEGAVQDRWSVSQMRRRRWETLGGDASSEPAEGPLYPPRDDEDFVPLPEADAAAGERQRGDDGSAGPRYDDPDFGDESAAIQAGSQSPDDLRRGKTNPGPWQSTIAAGQSTELPTDLAEPFEHFKLAIIRHRAVDGRRSPPPKWPAPGARDCSRCGRSVAA